MGRLVGLLIFAAILVALASAGCEALVGSDLPAFACTPGATAACPNGEVCSPSGVCVSACPEAPCPSGRTCNPESRLCVPTVEVPEAGGDVEWTDTTVDALPDVSADVDANTAAELGAPCQTSPSCKPGLLCADSSVLTADVVRTTGAVCTKTCCASEDCPRDFACYGPGTGGNYCVRATQLPRGTARGTTRGGAPCATPSDCRSGVCLDLNGAKRCADACCIDGPCPGGGVCQLATVETHLTMACGQPASGSVGSGQSCSIDACANGLCLSNTCRPRCCGKASCEAKTFHACVYLSQPGALVQEYVPGCLYPGSAPPGVGQVGSACPNGDSDCETHMCEPSTGACTDVCCTDADCAAYPGYTACRPNTNPNFHYLICSRP